MEASGCEGEDSLGDVSVPCPGRAGEARQGIKKDCKKQDLGSVHQENPNRSIKVIEQRRKNNCECSGQFRVKGRT